MADFNITRSAGLASLSSLLRGIVYLSVIAAWKHDSGAWLCVGTVPGHPDHYSIHWRSTEHWGSGALEFTDAFYEPDRDAAWSQAMNSAEAAWEAGPSIGVLDKAAKTKEMLSGKLREGGTRGGQKSGETRAKQAEEHKDALELAKRFRIHERFMPKYDPRAWTFNPGWNMNNEPKINFTWKKQGATYAYLTPNPEGKAWEIGRGWFPGMNDDNARIEEVCFRDIDDSRVALAAFERLLKTDPEKWLREDYVRFAPTA